MKIIVAGDIHGMWYYLNNMISKELPNIILQVGDFGYWPHYHKSTKFDGTGFEWDQYGIENKNTKIYFCDGNHENHDALEELIDKNNHQNPIQIPNMNNVFYMPRGSVLRVENKNILFIGGAYSIDKINRIPFNSWWPQEQISRKDIERLDEIEKNIDIVISHTLPLQCFKYLDLSIIHEDSPRWLDIVFDKFKPKKWYFGHFHLYKKFKHDNCVFTCLNDCLRNNWYEELTL